MDWKGQVQISKSLSLSLSYIALHRETRTKETVLIICLYYYYYYIRWAFIDLTAGPFSWGPAVGGEGVRTELSLPNVGKTIGAVEGDIIMLGCYQLLSINS